MAKNTDEKPKTSQKPIKKGKEKDTNTLSDTLSADGRIKPGEVRNPHGRPRKGAALTELLKEYLDAPDPETGIERKRMLAGILYGHIKNGDTDMIKYVYDRVDGKPDIFKHIQTMEIPQITISVRKDTPDA